MNYSVYIFSISLPFLWYLIGITLNFSLAINTRTPLHILIVYPSEPSNYLVNYDFLFTRLISQNCGTMYDLVPQSEWPFQSISLLRLSDNNINIENIISLLEFLCNRKIGNQVIQKKSLTSHFFILTNGQIQVFFT